MNSREIIQKIRESNHIKIKYGVPDIDGILRSKYIHKQKFLEPAENQIGFYDVVFGWDFKDAC